MVHLVYCDSSGKKQERVLELILANRKTMVIRGAAGRKIPHSRVFENEILYFMEKGTSSISAKARVTAVKNYVKLNDDEISKIINENNEKLCLTNKQKEKWHKKCICLVKFNNVEPINPPLKFEKQANMDDWMILEKIEDVLVGTSIPYSYVNSKLK